MPKDGRRGRGKRCYEKEVIGKRPLQLKDKPTNILSHLLILPNIMWGFMKTSNQITSHILKFTRTVPKSEHNI